MQFVLKFKKDKLEKVPAVVHFDGTARLQTVSKNDNSWYYGFLKKWEEKTGVPIILNTSFKLPLSLSILEAERIVCHRFSIS